MFRKNFCLALSLIFITGCGDGISGLNKTKLPSASPASGSAKSSVTGSSKLKFAEPVTEVSNPSPAVQVISYQKILRALDSDDFAYVNKEYSAGGLKYAAQKADTEFAEVPLSSYAYIILQNIGMIGLQNKNITTFDTPAKKDMFSKLLQQVLIYSVRGQVNRIIEYNKSGIAKDDKFSTDLANNMATYFYGNENGTVAENSIAGLSKAIDKSNGLETKTFDSIISGINLVKSSAKDNLNGVITGKNVVEKGLFKILYFATLEQVALAASTKNVNILDDAQFYYVGIQKPVKVTSINNNSYLDVMFMYKRKDLIDYPKFEKGMNQGFFERAAEEMNSAVAKIETDNNTARNSALSARLFIDIPNSTFKNIQATRTADPELTKNIDDFTKAIGAKDINQSKSLKDKINQTISAIMKK
jgi:hypothetical protein